MKSILISIKPQWCEKIASGKKTIEVRKSAPQEVPFKCYIYETKGKKIECGFHLEDTGITLREKIVFGMHKARVVKHYRNEGKGKVIGEFICDKVYKYEPNVILCAYYEVNGAYVKENLRYNSGTCLSYEDMVNYSNGKPLYGWHISDLKIYDKPKELSEFYTIAESGSDCCCGCVWHETPLDEMPCRTCTAERNYLYRPTMSWQYVEELIK